MSSCLGLYIDTNYIKYAKVEREKDVVRVNAFGIRFYDDFKETIKQIIEETGSYKTPISINLSEEVYNYFYFFNLLSKKDLKKAVDTEFEVFCANKNYNKNALESRYILVQDVEDKEKIKAIHITANKAEINEKLKYFTENQISVITSLPVSITNLLASKPNENVLIVNIENKTTITKIVNKNINEVIKLEVGAKEFIDKISSKENSYAKAYEICKNTTIYTMEKEYTQEETTYLEDIMPVLYKIAEKTKKIIDKSSTPIDKVYITGLGSMINNIDLYFQEYLVNQKCELLRPYFIKESLKINIKDFMEVNSALSLAMQGVGKGIKEINFKKQTLSDSIPDILTKEIGSSQKNGKSGNGKFKTYADEPKKWLIRLTVGLAELCMMYIALTMILNSQMTVKLDEVNSVYENNKEQMVKAEVDLLKIKANTTKYVDMKNNLTSYSKNKTTQNEDKNVIPTLLSELMSAIPNGDISLTSIENTVDKEVSIEVQSSRYDLLGFFISEIKDGKILNNVTSSPGTSAEGKIKIVIKGELP